MVKELILNGTPIHVEQYQEETVNGIYQICVDFKVTNDDYHAITTLLYEGTFDVKVPERNLVFKGTIQQYSTSVTNLYEKGQTGIFSLCLREVKV